MRLPSSRPWPRNCARASTRTISPLAISEFARPTIRDGLAALAERGARRIHAVPAMLFAASHVKNDLPWR
jgi:sirohydrochlorin ferrochelatase